MANFKYYNPQRSAILGRFSKTDTILPDATTRRWPVPPKYPTEVTPVETKKIDPTIPNVTEGSDATSTPGETGGVPEDPGGELSPETAASIGRNISGLVGFTGAGNLAANALGAAGYAAPAAVGGMSIAKAGYDAITGAKTKSQALKDAVLGLSPVAGTIIGSAIAPGIGTIAGGLIGHYGPKLYDKYFGVPNTQVLAPVEGVVPLGPQQKTEEQSFNIKDANWNAGFPGGYDKAPGTIQEGPGKGLPETIGPGRMGFGPGYGMSMEGFAGPQGKSEGPNAMDKSSSFNTKDADWGGFIDSLNEDSGWSGGMSSGETSSGDNSSAGEGGWG